MKQTLIVLILVFLVQPDLSAQGSPKLSGIMQGETPTAIINDQILAVGEETDGCRVVEIGADFVVCEAKKGTVRLMLAQAQDDLKADKGKSKTVSASPVVEAPVAAAAQGTTQQMQARARKSLDKSIEYLKEADALLKSPFMFEWLYAKAIDLCEQADREAQSALRSVAEDAVKQGVNTHIEKIRKAKEMIVKEKANFNTRIRALIAARQLITGMTQRDVVSSWGQPLMRNRDGELEKWIFQDGNGHQKELVFKDGILVGF